MNDAPANVKSAALEELRRPVTSAAYEAIRAEWTRHSIAEDARDLPGLIATLTEDCVYELLPWGKTWHGHSGAAEFYAELLSVFPDVDFALQHIVIGPQGVWEEAQLTGTFSNDWLGYTASGAQVSLGVQIFFPWDARRQKFSGERVFVDKATLDSLVE